METLLFYCFFLLFGMYGLIKLVRYLSSKVNRDSWHVTLTQKAFVFALMLLTHLLTSLGFDNIRAKMVSLAPIISQAGITSEIVVRGP